MTQPANRIKAYQWARRVLIWAISLFGGSHYAQSETVGLISQLQELGLRFALLVEAGHIEDMPVWSPDGRLLAVHMERKWSALNTETVILRMGTWQDRQTIAVAHPPAELKEISGVQIGAWRKAANSDLHRLTTKTGVTIELAPEGLGTSFRVTRKGSEPDVLWKTGLESCHSLSLSPDETMAAFICEKNGLLVFAVPP